jgi:hypothetical protein
MLSLESPTVVPDDERDLTEVERIQQDCEHTFKFPEEVELGTYNTHEDQRKFFWLGTFDPPFSSRSGRMEVVKCVHCSLEREVNLSKVCFECGGTLESASNPSRSRAARMNDHPVGVFALKCEKCGNLFAFKQWDR